MTTAEIAVPRLLDAGAIAAAMADLDHALSIVDGIVLSGDGVF